MKAFKILEVKDFMSKLLLKNTFDHFHLFELSLTTNITYTIDGSLHPDFYDVDETEQLKTQDQNHVAWDDVRPFCFSLIKGKRTPLHFKIVFQLPKDILQNLLNSHHLTCKADDIFGFYLNCQFDGTSLTCVTGTSLRFFTMDKTLDYIWDDYMTYFFKNSGISFEIV